MRGELLGGEKKTEKRRNNIAKHQGRCCISQSIPLWGNHKTGCPLSSPFNPPRFAPGCLRLYRLFFVVPFF